ncbi:hypothetical protein LBMAG42_57230 [Deltaproteobacteria bacterium]|nr:hypothetical protein LBMAG42_57230 [Deltaproteobacteria bacterium]
MEIARHIARVVAEATGVLPTPIRGFNANDDDIWVSVPPDTRVRGEPVPNRPPRPALRQEGRPFVAISESSARIGETALVRGTGHPLAPAPELFQHTCIDAPTAALLGFLASSVRLREPTLLEGPTAAGKTSAILYLASILRHPVIRLNLGGQTDTGELIGRYAPRAGGWSWQEGLIPRAMREGWWVILDEINLAEPSIVERLNPVLERSPSLVVSEGDGARLGPGGAPVAAGFHIFATMNPSGGEYGGRSPLSPALRDRFAAQRLCTTPGERDVRDLLFRMVLGEQPAITLSSVGWEGSQGLPATHAGLADVAEIRTLLTALARFHASVDAATRCEAVDQRLGADRREGVVVSRRTLLSVLDYLEARVPEVGIRRATSQAIDRYYLDRLSAADDRHAVIRLADAAGLVALAELPAALAAREAS